MFSRRFQSGELAEAYQIVDRWRDVLGSQADVGLERLLKGKVGEEKTVPRMSTMKRLPARISARPERILFPPCSGVQKP